MNEVISRYEEQIDALLKRGERPAYSSLRFTYWQATDESIAALSEQDPLGDEKRAAFWRILAGFKLVGSVYNQEQDDCVVS